jgi:Predicted permease
VNPAHSHTFGSHHAPLSTTVRWLVLLLVLAGVYFFHGFLVPVLAALIIGFASWPLYRRLVAACRGRTALSASIALCIVLLVLVIPLALLLAYMVEEVRASVVWLQEASQRGIPVPDWIGRLPLVGERLAEEWGRHLAEPYALGEVVQLVSGQNIASISRWLLAAGSGALSVLLNVVFVLITLFFIYKDGSALIAQLDRIGERILPNRWQRFSRVVPATVSSTVTGMTLIAIGEGIVLGIAYKIAGMPSSFILGVITGVMALIPGGAPTAFTLVSAYLAVTGNVVAGIALFAWGSIELFIVDKTLRPKLVGGPIRLPFLPTFFGLIGGVKTMGLVGLFVGPVLMALLVAVWREWIRALDDEPPMEKPKAIQPLPAAPAVSEPAVR